MTVLRGEFIIFNFQTLGNLVFDNLEAESVLNSHDTKWLWKGKREKFYMQCFYNFHAFYPRGIVTVNLSLKIKL